MEILKKHTKLLISFVAVIIALLGGYLGYFAPLNSAKNELQKVIKSSEGSFEYLPADTKSNLENALQSAKNAAKGFSKGKVVDSQKILSDNLATAYDETAKISGLIVSLQELAKDKNISDTDKELVNTTIAEAKSTKTFQDYSDRSNDVIKTVQENTQKALLDAANAKREEAIKAANEVDKQVDNDELTELIKDTTDAIEIDEINVQAKALNSKVNSIKDAEYYKKGWNSKKAMESAKKEMGKWFFNPTKKEFDEYKEAEKAAKEKEAAQIALAKKNGWGEGTSAVNDMLVASAALGKEAPTKAEYDKWVAAEKKKEAEEKAKKEAEKKAAEEAQKAKEEAEKAALAKRKVEAEKSLLNVISEFNSRMGQNVLSASKTSYDYIRINMDGVTSLGTKIDAQNMLNSAHNVLYPAYVNVYGENVGFQYYINGDKVAENRIIMNPKELKFEGILK
jgi:colicin import membrane protein